MARGNCYVHSSLIRLGYFDSLKQKSNAKVNRGSVSLVVTFWEVLITSNLYKALSDYCNADASTKMRLMSRREAPACQMIYSKDQPKRNTSKILSKETVSNNDA